MPKYEYTAVDARGNETAGEIDVESPAAAINKLKEMGYFPTKITEAGAGKGRKSKVTPAAGAKAGKKGGWKQMEINIPGVTDRVNKKLLTIFTRQLATLIDAGLPLLRALRTLERQERNSALRRPSSRCPRRSKAARRFPRRCSTTRGCSTGSIST